MSNEGFKVQASIKDADGDMVNFRGDSPEELAAYLNGFDYGAYAQAKANLRGSSSVAAIAQSSAPAAPVQQAPAQPQPQAWGNAQPQAAPPQQQAAPPSWALGACELPGCGQPLERKATSTGKPVDRCPAWRWNNGNANGHTNNFI